MAWTPDMIEKMTAMWAAGESTRAIASVLGGVTRNAVIGKINRLGLQRKKAAPSFSPDGLSELWATPLPIGAIAAKLGITYETARKTASRMGLPPKPIRGNQRGRRHPREKRTPISKRCVTPVTFHDADMPDPVKIDALRAPELKLECRWVAALAGADTTYCGSRDGMRGSYCGHHARIVYRAVDTR